MSLAFTSTSIPFLTQALQVLALAFDAVGVVVVILAAVIAAFRYLRREMRHSGTRRFRAIDSLRYDFGQRMILGLEFFLAGDIIRLIVTPTLEGLLRLGAIVTIRTVLSYFLMKETENMKIHPNND